jgi:alpha-ribazole phosphatase
MTLALTLLRHAPTDAPPGILSSRPDLPAILTDQQTRLAALAAALPAAPAWCSSPYRRCRETLEAVLAARGEATAAVTLIDGFREQDFGAWEGRSYDELWRELGPAGWRAPARMHPPGGENFLDVLARVREALEQIAAAPAAEEIVLSGHVGSIRAALASALDLSPEAALGLAIDHLSTTRLIYADGAWRVDHVNRIFGVSVDA